MEENGKPDDMMGAIEFNMMNMANLLVFWETVSADRLRKKEKGWEKKLFPRYLG